MICGVVCGWCVMVGVVRVVLCVYDGVMVCDGGVCFFLIFMNFMNFMMISDIFNDVRIYLTVD